jgi:DNA-binding NtrC family response regulator
VEKSPHTAVVLIVDDEKVVCDALARHMRGAGYDVLVAHNGQTAIDHIAQREVEVALIDIRMPGIDGFGVLEVLKQRRPGAKAVMMTSYADIKSAVESISRGAVDILSKPVDREEVLVTIRRCLETGESRSAGAQSG